MGFGRWSHVAVVALAMVGALFVSRAEAQGEVRSPLPSAEAALDRLFEVPNDEACAETGAEVAIEGIGRAVYDRIAFDGAAGTARLRGGVCIELEDGSARLRADSVDLAGLLGETAPTLDVSGALLSIDAWQLSLDRLTGPIDALRMEAVVLLGPGVVGQARSGGLTGGVLSLDAVAVATSRYLIEARRASLEGQELVLLDASGTSCTCDVERYRLSGSELRSTLEGGTAEILNPRVRVFGLDVPLGDVLTLRPDGSDLAFPIVVESRTDLGTVAVWTGGDERVSLEAGATTDLGAFPLVTLRVRPEDALAELSFDRRGVRIDAYRDLPIPGGTARLFSRTDLQDDDPRLRNGVEVRTDRWNGQGRWGSTDLTGSASARAGIEIAADPSRGVAGVRAPSSSEASLTVALADPLDLELSSRAEAVAYPGTPGFDRIGQAAATLTARVRLDVDALEADAFAQRRVAVGSTPFAFDELTDRARIGATASWQGGPFALRFRTEWRFAPEDPGAEHLEASVSTVLFERDGWRASVRAEADVAAAFDGPSDEDWFEVGASLSHDVGVRLDVAHRWEVDPEPTRSMSLGAAYEPAGPGFVTVDVRRDLTAGRWTSITAGGAWPIVVAAGTVEARVVPRLGVEVAPWLAGDEAGPRWTEHGLTIEWTDCCGTVRVGYLVDDEDGLSIDVGLVLPVLEFAPLPRVELPPLPALPSTYGESP